MVSRAIGWAALCAALVAVTGCAEDDDVEVCDTVEHLDASSIEDEDTWSTQVSFEGDPCAEVVADY